jgi:hypothetical protein
MAPRCPARRVKGRFCNAHRCEEPECNRQRVSEDNGFTFKRYCSRHTCNAPYCSDLAVFQQDCQTVTTGYCEAHRRCKVSGCGRRCHMTDDGGLVFYCGQHYCHFKECQEQRVGEGKLCPAHTCRRANCVKGVKTNEAPYCTDHTCKFEQCPSERFRDAEWCADHMCNFPGCRDQAYIGFRAARYCERHGHGGNGGPDWPGGGGSGGRPAILRTASGYHTHVDHDTCHWNYGGTRCVLQCVAHTHFCIEHLCGFTDCQVPRLNDQAPYCAVHRCCEGGCLNLCLGAGLSGRNHGCEATRTRMFCADHNCQSPDCNGRAMSNSRFCRRHTCRQSGCENEALHFGSGGLCDFHYEGRRGPGYAGAGGGYVYRDMPPPPVYAWEGQRCRGGPPNVTVMGGHVTFPPPDDRDCRGMPPPRPYWY